MLSRRAAVALSLLLVAGSVAACTDDEPEARPDDTTTTSVTAELLVDQDPCDLLEAEEVAAELAIDITWVDGNAEVLRCVWAPDEAEIALQLLVAPSQQDFELLLGRHAGVFGDPTELEGPGDQAYFFDAEGVARILVHREGGPSFELDMLHKDYPDMATDHQAALEALAELAVERLDA